ncbi:RNA-directed DNA polymerase, eukaryota, reverse transcriptase zinc-binding domain protein [Tanacetum coccineum]
MITIVSRDVGEIFLFDYAHSDWIPNGTKLLIISIYAPQDLSEKKMLWDYLSHVIAQWAGEVVVMGDFNEVRKKDERFGSVFNVHGANAFNLPVPFRFFHYWFEIKGFDKFVEDFWKEAVVVEINAMTKLMKKLKHLKEKIRLWNKGNTMSSINRNRTLKSDLADLDLIIDKRCGDVEIVNKRANVVRSLQELENLQSLEAAQKSKIKWAIEGDENSKYYHGILNKKRSQLAIRGILVDGNWIDSPHLPDQIIDLECDVSKDEIKRAVWDCGTDKSPGPDGFTFGFYRRYWNILESDVVDAVTSFFSSCCLRSSRGSVIVNGSPTEEFQFHKGLKQGLRLNMSKSKLMGIYVDADKVAQAARKIGCVTLKTPFTYLGSKVGGHMSRIQSWNETIEAMASRLSKWKMKTLSIGGRLTLLKSVLGSMPYLIICPIFQSSYEILQRMESIRSHFFNGSDPLAKKPTWVKWTNVLASKEKGGLRISSLYALNRALMFKWVWRFLSQNSSLWANVIKSIHGEHLKIVGNGSNTLFWEETWHGDVAFKFLFPRAYALESCKNIDVASKLSQNSLAFTFRRETRDRWIWSLQSSGDFTVASIRKLIDEFTFEVSSSTRWIKAVPIKTINVLDLEPSGLAQMATKGNHGKVVTTYERSRIRASP